MGKLDDAASAYFEGLAADKFGVDWRQKRRMLEAQTRGVEASTAKTQADTLHTQAQTKQAGVETEGSQFDLAEKRRKLEELKGLVASGKLQATQLEAVQALIATGEADLARQAAPGRRALTTAQTNQANATAEYMRRRPTEGSTQGWKQVMMNGKLAYHNFLTGETRDTPPGMTDLSTGRKDLENARAAGSFDVLIQQTDKALARYEQHFKGFERVTPSFLNPEKAVARQAYESKLGQLAQLFGRTVLMDNRVSDQDRQVYTAAIGQASEPLMTYDPQEARRRLDDLKEQQEHYKATYGAPGMNLQPGGGANTGAPLDVDAFLDSLLPPRQ